MEIRPYHPNDYNDIVELCKFIWEGNDYLPSTINQYYEEEHCRPYILLEGGKVVSVCNAHFYTKDFVWLEAMRTHPDYRSKGLASKLSEKILKDSVKIGTKEAWLSTSSNNQATAKMLGKSGFQEMFRMKVWGFGSTEIDETELSTNKGIIDGSLVTSRYLDENIPDSVKGTQNDWRAITNIAELESSKKTIPFLFSEFMICPIESHFIPEWIEKGYILKNIKTNSLMTLKESKEENGMYIVGISDTNKENVLSALYFAYKKVESILKNSDLTGIKPNLSLFFHNDVDIEIFHNSWIFRIMRKKLS